MLVGWIATVVLSQLARGLVIWGFGLSIMALGMLLARRRGWRLLRRVRFLLLVLIVLFAFFTPGEAMLPILGRFSPTYEGAAMAAMQGLRLVVVVMLVALLLEKADERALVSGLIVLAWPLRGLGLSIERLAVRLLLVFRYIETPPSGGWRALLAPAPEGGAVDRLTVCFSALCWWDRLFIAGLLCVILWSAIL